MAFSFAELGSSLLLFCLVFGMSGTVQISSLQKQMRNRTALLIGVCLQFLILPAVGFIVVKLFSLPAEMGVILLVITSSPGGSYSNWWCSLFNAELALSVTMTTLSTLLSVIMLPLNLILYTRWDYDSTVVKSLDWSALIVSLCVVMGGIGGGLLASWHSERQNMQHVFHTRANRMGNVAGILLITLSFSVSSLGGGGSGSSSSGAIWEQSAKFYIAIALPAITGLGIAIFAATKCQLEPPERVAVAVESCYQNTGIATSVAITLYKGDALATAIGVPLYYGIVEACILGVFCLVAWKFLGWTKAPRDENICVMLYNSYEVDANAHGVKEPEHAIEVVLDTTTTNDMNSSSNNGSNHLNNNNIPNHDLIFAQTEQGGAYIVDEACLPKIQKQIHDKHVRISAAKQQQHPHLHHRKHSATETCAATVLEHGDGDDDCYDDVNLQDQQQHGAAARQPQQPQPTTPVAQQHEANQIKGRRRQAPVIDATAAAEASYFYGQAPLGSSSPTSPENNAFSQESSLPSRPRLYSANQVLSNNGNELPPSRPRTSSANNVRDVTSTTATSSSSSAGAVDADEESRTTAVTTNTTIAATAAEVVADRLSIAMSVIRARATGYQHATENEANCPRAPPSVLMTDAATATATITDDAADDGIRPVAVIGRVID